MRLHPPTTILAIIALFLAGLAASNKQKDQLDDERCKVAVAFIKTAFDDGAVFDGAKPIILRPEFASPSGVSDYLSSENALPSDKVNPLLPLVFELEETRGVNVADICPGVLELSDRLAVEPDRDPVVDEDGNYDRIYFHLNVPAVEKDGRIALIEAGFVYAGLAGSGRQVLMLKDNQGQWRIAYQQNTWVS